MLLGSLHIKFTGSWVLSVLAIKSSQMPLVQENYPLLMTATWLEIFTNTQENLYLMTDQYGSTKVWLPTPISWRENFVVWLML